jgi:hypothetical protein
LTGTVLIRICLQIQKGEIVHILFKKSFKLFFVFSILVAAVACNKKSTLTEKEPSVYSHANVAAAGNIENSFVSIKNLSPNDDLHLDQERIQLKKNALEKEFLLQISLIPQPSAAMSSGMKSRVVAFRRRADKVYLLEATQGHSVTNDLPQNLVLAEMSVLSEDDSSLVIDFNKGMARLMVASDWRASDFNSKYYNSQQEFASIPLQYAYIENASVEQNHLVIRQVAQAIIGGEMILPVEVKYYLSPYQPSKEFESARSLGDFDRLGFFETAPLQRINESDIIFATKFNKKAPIVFAVSANTPVAFRQAIKDGILYWNKAFGYEALKVIDAPQGVTAPSLNYNVVQWVNFDNAGFAYADAQVDPRTGETLHAQVYFTSAFAVGGKRQARIIISKWDAQQSSDKIDKRPILGLKGFTLEPRCSFALNENFVNNLRGLVYNQVDDAKILKAAQDYIREVAAHEIGHTLGLRHNFAGSLAANYEVSERSAIDKAYYETGSVPEKLVPSSSVMEYQVFEEATWTGDLIAKAKVSLPYDEKAIQNLYLGKIFEDSEIPLFCTDSHAGRYGDCERFDVGHSLMQALKVDEETAANNIALSLLYRFIIAKAPPAGEPAKPLKKVALPDPKMTALQLNTKSIGLLSMLNTSFKVLSIYRAYPIVDSSMESSVQQSQLDYLQSEIQSQGDWPLLLSDNGNLTLELAKATFKKLLQDQRKGLGFADQEYEFSDEELHWISDRAEAFFQKASSEIQLANTNVLNGNVVWPWGTFSLGTLPNHEISVNLASVLLVKARALILAETGEKSFVEISVPNADKTSTQKVTVALPTYKYSYEIRKTAAEFLRAVRSKSVVWGVMERKVLLDEFKQATKATLTVDLSTLKAEDMPNIKAAQWIQENQNIQATIGGNIFNY